MVPVPVLVQLLDYVPERYRALLLLATFANLRFGELAGLRRGQVDLDQCEVRVRKATAETDDGRLIDDDPKSRAGIRVVSFPADIVPELADHLERFAAPGPGGLVFIGLKGGVCGARTSANSGTGHVKQSACPSCTFMTCGTPATRWPPLKVRVSVS